MKYSNILEEEIKNRVTQRRDLLVPQDVRERKGSFFTPKIWVELSQKYLADVFGKDWQDEYYIWDCAAGTGNLLAGLTNKYNIWASTLDKADVDVMKDRIENGANLLESHVFQFDFLNDDFIPVSKGGKLPDGLFDIINNEKRRKKLIVYINPPYAEAAIYGIRDKAQVARNSKASSDFAPIIGTANNELFAQFFCVIYKKIPNSNMASFGTLKYITASNFIRFRDYFKAKYLTGFVCPANTFDNVNGEFPIGFLIWDLANKKDIKKIQTDVFERDGIFAGKKIFYAHKKGDFFSNWLSEYYDKKEQSIGYLKLLGTDMQTNRGICVYSYPSVNDLKKHMVARISIKNLFPISIYFAVRKCIKPTWLNNRDQFLYPNNKWKNDIEFHNDCLAYTLFNNNISSKYGVNHWIPFMENEVNARDSFDSHFMAGFISGKIIQNGYSNLFEKEEEKLCAKREFSPEATTVFDAGRELWKYYHAQPNINVNASLYDIREYFQGRNEKGNMNNKSDDETYNKLIAELRSTLQILAKKIKPKVYEYGFLME